MKLRVGLAGYGVCFDTQGTGVKFTAIYFKYRDHVQESDMARKRV